jgi:hypothetical protein
MSAVIESHDIERKLGTNSNFEIRNGLLGVKRDIFLLLIGFMNFYHGDNKTRNVRTSNKFVYLLYIDDRNERRLSFVDLPFTLHHFQNQTKNKSPKADIRKYICGNRGNDCSVCKGHLHETLFLRILYSVYRL